MNFLKTNWIELNVEPIIQLHNQSPLFGDKSRREIIICIHYEKVGYGGIAPLKPGVDIQVINLIVVLNEGCPKQTFRKGQIHSWPN